MSLIKGVTGRVISITQLKILKDFNNASKATLWLKQQGFKKFGRVTVDKQRHEVWFNPILIRRDRVRKAFKKEMK